MEPELNAPNSNPVFHQNEPNWTNWNCLINQTEPELITMGLVQSSVSTVIHSICTVELNVLYLSYILVIQCCIYRCYQQYHYY